MKRRALLLLLASSACRRQGAEQQPFTLGLLRAAQQSGQASEADVERSLTELWHLADMARAALATRRHQPEATVIAELVFGRLGFQREVDDPALDFVFLPGVLRRRRGSCVGLGTLVLALSEQLGWSAAGVMMPGHFYVRLDDGRQHCNLELLHAGQLMPDAWYTARFPIAGGTAPEYARPLRAREVLGVLAYNLGNERRRAARIQEARAAFSQAVALFPDFSEAHASLGAVQHLLGQLEPAASSYRAALEKYPQLPGLRKNIALLDAERGLPTF